MMTDEERKRINSLYTEVLNGFSIRRNNKFGSLYIKHFNPFDMGELDFEKEGYYQHAIKEGLPTQKEQLERAIEDGFWSKEKDNRILDLENSIINMGATKNKLPLRSQKLNLQRRINESQKELDELFNEKVETMGLTAEAFADKKASEYYIFRALRKKEDISKNYFSDEDFDELPDSDLYELIHIYNGFSKDFSSQNLRRIAMSSNFLNLYHLCSDSPRELFGFPVVRLTFFQAEVFGSAKYFKGLLNEAKHKPTDHIYRDPDALIEWVDSNSGGRTEIENKMTENGGGVSYVGATQDDLKDMGVDKSDTISFSEEADKKGGSLDFQDILRMHGHKT